MAGHGANWARGPLGSLPTVAYRLGPGPRRALLSASGDCEAILGLSAQALTESGLAAWRQRISSNDARRNRAAIRAALRRRERYVLAYRLRQPDGKRRWVAESGVGRWDSRGRLVAVEGLLVDLRDMAHLVGLQQTLANGLGEVLAAADELAGAGDLPQLCRRAVELARERLGLERCGLFLIEPDGASFRGTTGTNMARQSTDEGTSVIREERLVNLVTQPVGPGERLWRVALEQPFEWDGRRGQPLPGPPVWVALTPLRTNRSVIGFLSNDQAVSRTPLDDARQDLVAVYAALLAGLIERQQTHDALRRQQDDYQALFAHSLNALALHEMVYDDEGQPVDYRYLMTNAQFERLTGMVGVDGKLVSEVLPEDHRPYVQAYAKVVETGEPLRAEIAVESLGRVYDVTAYRPRPGQFAVAFTDITEARARAAEQQLNEARLNALLQLNQMSDTDDDGLCRFALEQGAALTGSEFGYLAFTSEDETVLTMHAWSHEAMAQCTVDGPRTRYLVAETGLWGEPIRQRQVVITNHYDQADPLAKGTPDGHVSIARHMGVPVLDGERIVAVCGVANKARPYDESDARQLSLLMGGMWRVLEQRRAQAALAAAEAHLLQSSKMEAVGRLAGGVAHDFNNLLTTILGYTELALGSLRAGDPLRADLEAISRAGDRANGLVRQLLAFSRRQALATKVLDVNALVRGMVEMVEPLIGADIDLRLDLAADLARVKADPGGLEQVLMNLAVNARDAMPQGGTLTIATANTQVHQAQAHALFDGRAGRHVVLSVADTGVGMDEATRARLFEPFFSTKEKGKGTGFGLSTSYGIVRQCGGHITVASEVGHGSLFSVYLPATDDQPDSEIDEPAARQTAPGRGTILLVEDQAEVRSLARRILDSQGYRVLEAADGQEAIDLLGQTGQPIDLLLTDVVMPRLGGLDLARQLRAKQPHLPVLFVSGYTDSDLARNGAGQPGTAFLPKPYSPATLSATIRQLLEADPNAMGS